MLKIFLATLWLLSNFLLTPAISCDANTTAAHGLELSWAEIKDVMKIRFV